MEGDVAAAAEDRKEEAAVPEEGMAARQNSAPEIKYKGTARSADWNFGEEYAYGDEEEEEFEPSPVILEWRRMHEHYMRIPSF